MADHRELDLVWRQTAEGLPDGWSLDGLRCASIGLSEQLRSDVWIAVAVGPDGEERRHRATGPIDALRGLTATFEAM